MSATNQPWCDVMCSYRWWWMLKEQNRFMDIVYIQGRGQCCPCEHCHLKQLWTREWQKASAALTIKPWAQPLIVPVQRQRARPRALPKALGVGSDGWMEEWAEGGWGVGTSWHRHLTEWVASSFTAPHLTGSWHIPVWALDLCSVLTNGFFTLMQNEDCIRLFVLTLESYFMTKILSAMLYGVLVHSKPSK